MKYIAILIFLFVNLNASMVFSCFTEFIIHEGKRYSPPDNMKKFMIRFSDDKNILVFKTQNGQSHYNYKSFIPPTENIKSIGVSYENEGKFLDIFNDNYLYFGFIDSGLMLKAKCPSMNLNIKVIGKNSIGQTIYGF
ncbi:hypothetical protein [Aliarcobacter thereius]|uniref:Uncharacterized protein n=1 Tax=Aliarcobacter thereius LMG 24486 TaxID=1032240 RepID=A0A1C7WTG3_9BACT|nr:hypothetical protein [Aliarcobacter thereius]OCL95762.1 hypothetical protein AA347_01242 [Aliarcobacter thereius LMG 24486]QBF16263.1 hypothetical protein ATH_1211 [Aliarcobacter thereius LMG 24486]TLS92114.1 hypothetical protein FE244_06840 [Aliarcobacter thereius]